jgi:hypothetical protein
MKRKSDQVTTAVKRWKGNHPPPPKKPQRTIKKAFSRKKFTNATKQSGQLVIYRGKPSRKQPAAKRKRKASSGTSARGITRTLAYDNILVNLMKLRNKYHKKYISMWNSKYKKGGIKIN